MRSFMRNAVLTTAAILLSAAGTAHASPSPVLTANVPFAFSVNGQHFAAGKYTVERDDTAPSVLLIHGQGNNRAAVFIETIPNGEHDPAGSKPILTFNKNEKEYRLSTVWASANQGWDVPSK